MENVLFRAPSIGGVINKILAINENLSSPEIIQIVRQSMRTRSGEQSEFASVEVIDEQHALSLARASLKKA